MINYNDIPVVPLKLSFTDWLKAFTGRGERYCLIFNAELNQKFLIKETEWKQ